MYDVNKWGNFDKKYEIDPAEGKFIAVEKLTAKVEEIKSELKKCSEEKKEELENKLVRYETALFLVKERDFEDLLSGLPSTVGDGATVEEIYLKGLSEKRDGNYEEAVKLLKEARQRGSKEASVTLGVMAEDGSLFGEPDMDAARSFYEDGGEEGAGALENFDERYEKAAEERREKNLRELEETAAAGKDYEKMLELIKECGISEEDKLEYTLTYFRNSGDSDRYYECLEKVAELGNDEARSELAGYYIFVSKETGAAEKGFEIAEKLKNKNIPESSYYLGYAYANGKGVEKDDEKAIEYLKAYLENPGVGAGAKKYTAECAERLGDIYFVRSLPDTKNIELAVNYYKIAAEKGSATAEEKIGSCEEELSDIKQKLRMKIFKCAAAAAIVLALIATVKMSYSRYTSEAPDARAAETTVVETTEVEETSEPETTEVNEASEETQEGETTETEDAQYPYSYKSMAGDYDGTAIELKHLTASSVLEGKDDISYGPENLVDDDLSACWQEGEDGAGIGTVIGAELGESKSIKAISFNMGNQEKEEKYFANNRPSKINLVINGENIPVVFEDKMETQTIVFDEPVKADRFSVEITEVYTGSLYDDTCISGLRVFSE
ncbi:MAG: hypothetical protein K6F39_00070 [Lachnospiraceae bacterium]|nr:hypothetical protein [Lachnospiraceae bacterium]